MSFTSIANAVETAIKIQELYNCVITPNLEFNIGISAGVPVTQNENIFEDTINYLISKNFRLKASFYL